MRVQQQLVAQRLDQVSNPSHTHEREKIVRLSVSALVLPILHFHPTDPAAVVVQDVSGYPEQEGPRALRAAQPRCDLLSLGAAMSKQHRQDGSLDGAGSQARAPSIGVHAPN